LPVALLFARRRGPIARLGLPPRPGPRRLPARLAAIALPRLSRTKPPLTSFEQAPPAPRPFPPAARLIFGMACWTLGRAHGRSLLPEAPAPEGMALLSGAQQIFGSLLYRKDRMPAGSPLRRALFPQQGQLCAFRRSVNIVSFENQFRPARVQSTATQQWRRGPRWPAKMAPSLAAANTAILPPWAECKLIDARTRRAEGAADSRRWSQAGGCFPVSQQRMPLWGDLVCPTSL
jgi:hypothetical protein